MQECLLIAVLGLISVESKTLLFKKKKFISSKLTVSCSCSAKLVFMSAPLLLTAAKLTRMSNLLSTLQEVGGEVYFWTVWELGTPQFPSPLTLGNRKPPGSYQTPPGNSAAFVEPRMYNTKDFTRGKLAFFCQHFHDLSSNTSDLNEKIYLIFIINQRTSLWDGIMRASVKLRITGLFSSSALINVKLGKRKFPLVSYRHAPKLSHLHRTSVIIKK